MSPHDQPSRVHALASAATAPAIPAGQGASHAHGAESDHGHASHDPFPRLAVRNLIGDNLRANRRRELWQAWALTLGLVFMALALPTTRLLGDGLAPVQWSDRGAWFSTYLALQPIARLLEFLPSMGAERAWFLIAALCWAGSFLVLSRMAIALGVPRLVAAFSALLVLTSPLGFLSGTLPGPSAAALLGSAILFWALLDPTDRRAGGKRRLHPLSVWFGVCLLNPVLVLFLPAVVWSLISPRESRSMGWSERARVIGGAVLALAVLAALLTATAALGQTNLDLVSMAHGFELMLLGTGSTGAPDSVTWLLVLAPAIGVGVVGLIELFRRPSERTESVPPTWIVAFVGVPLVIRLLGGTPSLETGAWVLGPVVVLGLASFFGRMHERRHWSAMVGLLAVQLILTGGFRWTIVRGDPNRPWTELASTLLQPGDLVLTRDQEHDYLLRHRFHLKTVNLRVPHELDETERAEWWAGSQEAVLAQARAGQRVLVDWRVSEPLGGGRAYAFQRELHDLVLLAPILHLEKPPPPDKSKIPGETDQL